MPKKSYILLLSLVFALSVALVACGGGDSDDANGGNEEESVTWLANAVYPEDNHTTKALIDLGANVEEATDGQVELDVSPGGALGYEGSELLSAVKDNDVPV